MTDVDLTDMFVTKTALLYALLELREDAHYEYMNGSERRSERAYERREFIEKLAKLLALDLGPLP